MYTRNRLTPDERRQQILLAATVLAVESGLYNFSVTNVSRKLKNCSKSTIRHYFSLADLRMAVVDMAIADDNSAIVAQAITMKHRAVKRMNDYERRRHLNNV